LIALAAFTERLFQDAAPQHVADACKPLVASMGLIISLPAPRSRASSPSLT
jgi:hypothetical protein